LAFLSLNDLFDLEEKTTLEHKKHCLPVLLQKHLFDGNEATDVACCDCHFEVFEAELAEKG
jgi:hypothetical protein